MRKFIDIVLGRQPIFEMANLREPETGVAGLIYISSRESSHAARVKYFPGGKGGSSQPSYSVTIEVNPIVKARSKVLRQSPPAALMQWVSLNHLSLIDFWMNGYDWSPREIADFADRLIRV